ncbi:MAG: hypothetical protein DRO96_01115 [Candidatus Aenigmatarchaeota archaeon]|nr:MAG: hypothetical protein DRO96_01115 [Candidatus Aenigmarchaeota archaeon]
MLEDNVVLRVWRKRLIRTTRRIPLDEGLKGLYGGVLYVSNVSFSKQSVVVAVPRASLDGVDEDSIDRIIDASVRRHVGDSSIGYDARPQLSDQKQNKYDDNYGDRKY